MAAILKIKLALNRYDVLAFRAPRHLDSNGSRVDITLDDVLACISGRKLIINTSPSYYHLQLPTKCDERLHSSILCNLNSEVRFRFGVEVDVESVIKINLTKYRAALIQYGYLLDRARPKFVILTQNGIEKALFCAARMRSIPVVEAQHGLINYAHPAYSYPTAMSANMLNTLPTIFLTLSRHWMDKCHYPVEKSVVIGNRQLFVAPRLTGAKDILVVSSYIHEESIEKVLRPAATSLTERHFFYKLHPNQFGRLREIKERLSDMPNVEVISNEQTLQQLSQRCLAVFCICSTGVYEALQAGLSIYLLAKQDFQKHSDVFDHPRVHVVHNHDEFVRTLSMPQKATELTNSPVFFQSFDATAVTDLMTDLCK